MNCLGRKNESRKVAQVTQTMAKKKLVIFFFNIISDDKFSEADI